MVTHYSTNGLQAACGRTAQTLVSTGVSEQVSCKSCQRTLLKPAAVSVTKSPSLAELRKQASAAGATRPAATASVLAAPRAASTGFSVKAAWAAKLATQGHRAPRGKLRKPRD
ncbi:hypothetical protein [Pseudomonas sp. UBA6562]|uniref:hypothetical protein n=1 Tax=Pseudomonas sp. UBA6562 TaxID=1947332 RepID=UPI0025D3A57A|nr:hypothetical protein [Pseudomonas sp. UBA6562]